jgi:RNA polymerase sigma factor (sigma-70 family)
MPPSDASFWEIPLPPESFDARAHDPIADLFAEDDTEERRAARAEAVEILRLVISTRLTERQRQIVELHFLEGLSQVEVAERLGISQQTVSRQLFGAVRSGAKVGGAMKRLRSVLEEEGVTPERWV